MLKNLNIQAKLLVLLVKNKGAPVVVPVSP